MKLYQLLPQGHVSEVAKAAKVQSQQARVKRLAEEVAARKEFWHVSLLKTIDEYADKGNYVKVLQLIRLYNATYKNSPIAAEVEKLREWASDSLKPAKHLTHQGLPHVEKLPASWSKA